MTKFTRIFGFLSLALAMSFALSVNAAGPDKLTCFDGHSEGTIYGGTCTLSGSTATLNNTDGDPDGSYSGVYYPNDNLKGMMLGDIDHLSFSYTGTPTAGSPRISLPIDTNGDGTTDFYAFIGAYYCNDGAGNVNPLTDATCTIFAGSESFANWAALLAAHPDWKVGNNATFVIADDAGSWTVNNVSIGTQSKEDKGDKGEKDKGKAEGNLQLTNPTQKIEFNVSSKDGKKDNEDKDKGNIEYWNYDYSGGTLHYKAKAMCVTVDSSANTSRFMYQIPAGHPGLSGLYVIVSVMDGGKHGTNDTIGFSSTSDLATATSMCENGGSFTNYAITKGDIKVK